MIAFKRFLSFLLVLLMIFSAVPVGVLGSYNADSFGEDKSYSGPIITMQPRDSKARLGDKYCVTVEAEGEGLKYTWYGKDAGATSWFKSSVTDNTYDNTMTNQRAGRDVYCVITDAYGNSVTSDIARLILLPTYIWEQWTQPVKLTADTYPTYGGSSTGYYKNGQTFGGIIYSSTFREGTDVLWNLNHSTYYSAVANPASLLYTVDNRGKVYNESSWAGCVCSSTALKACGYDFPYSSAEVQAGFDKKADIGIDNIEFGDILWTSGHVAGVIGVNTADNGSVTSVKIIEQASTVRVFEVTAENWDSYFAKHWKAVYRGDFDESLQAPIDYPENLSIIFERGNNTYVSDHESMPFYIPEAKTVYLTRNGNMTEHKVESFPTKTVNGVTVYDLAELFTGVGDYYFHTELNETDICIKVINCGRITISGTDAILTGYKNCKPLGYYVIKIVDKNESTAYNFYEAPEGYTSSAVSMSFEKIDDSTFKINNIPTDTDGWKIVVFYDTDLGWARGMSKNVLYSEEPSTPLFLRYDDRYDVSGKTVEIVDAGKPTSHKVGAGVAEGTLDDAVITLDGDTLIATGIGAAMVRIDGVLYEVVVEKAKINIVTIMGQSNAGNHFQNATSDITCPPGTAYWWKKGATAPVDYTAPSMGFHTPLLAELYAQSVAAGDPVKNVMVWQEGATSKNGQSIVKWASSESDTTGTDATATMIKNCVAYYTQRSDKYEIVGNGIYWLQGEADVRMDSAKYERLFMAMWNKLKGVGAEYVAFFRVRKGTSFNTSVHEDLDYTGSLSAQINMINNNPDMFMATTITENWTGNESSKHSVDITKYITLMDEYGQEESFNDSYGNAATIKDGILTTTMKTLYGSNNKCHYGKFGYAIIGADAAYNMYRSLHTDEFSVVKSDTSGKAKSEIISKPGETVSLDITGMTEDLAFRAGCGSTSGTVSIKIMSKNTDITSANGMINTNTTNYGCVNVDRLRDFDDVTVVVTFTATNGRSGSVSYVITDNSIDPSDSLPPYYVWDFDTDLYARDSNGNKVNSFMPEALEGSYSIENGILKCNKLQLRLEIPITLKRENNWSLEIKFGAVQSSSRGFIFSSTAGNVVGNKALYHRSGGVLTVSDYARKGYSSSAGYYNYYSDTPTISSGAVITLVNTYDPETDSSILSLWKDGVLINANLQRTGDFNGSSSLPNMSQYEILADFVFEYLGCNNSSGTFLLTEEIDYIKVNTDIEHDHTVNDSFSSDQLGHWNACTECYGVLKYEPHSYSEKTVPPTSAEQGYTEHTCTVCGHSYRDSFTDPLPYLKGDVNGDGKVNNRDAARLMQYLAGWEVEYVEAALDVNGDGRINNRDAARLMQYLAGWEVEIH